MGFSDFSKLICFFGFSFFLVYATFSSGINLGLFVGLLWGCSDAGALSLSSGLNLGLLWAPPHLTSIWVSLWGSSGAPMGSLLLIWLRSGSPRRGASLWLLWGSSGTFSSSSCFKLSQELCLRLSLKLFLKLSLSPSHLASIWVSSEAPLKLSFPHLASIWVSFGALSFSSGLNMGLLWGSLLLNLNRLCGSFGLALRLLWGSLLAIWPQSGSPLKPLSGCLLLILPQSGTPCEVPLVLLWALSSSSGFDLGLLVGLLCGCSGSPLKLSLELLQRYYRRTLKVL